MFSNHNAQHDHMLIRHHFRESFNISYGSQPDWSCAQLSRIYVIILRASNHNKIKLVHYYKPFHRHRFHQVPNYQMRKTENAKQYGSLHAVSCKHILWTILFQSNIRTRSGILNYNTRYKSHIVHRANLLPPLTLPNANNFSNFFHQLSSKFMAKYYVKRVATLQSEMFVAKHSQWLRAEWSELLCKTQPFKTVAQKYSPNDVSVILFTDEKTFVTTPKPAEWPTVRISVNQEERRREKAPAQRISVQSLTASVGE